MNTLNFQLGWIITHNAKKEGQINLESLTCKEIILIHKYTKVWFFNE